MGNREIPQQGEVSVGLVEEPIIFFAYGIGYSGSSGKFRATPLFASTELSEGDYLIGKGMHVARVVIIEGAKIIVAGHEKMPYHPIAELSRSDMNNGSFLKILGEAEEGEENNHVRAVDATSGDILYSQMGRIGGFSRLEVIENNLDNKSIRASLHHIGQPDFEEDISHTNFGGYFHPIVNISGDAISSRVDNILAS